MFRFAIIPLLTATLALASPTTPKCPIIPQTANFDDIAGSVVASTRPPMNYKGLFFQGFGVVTEIITNLAPGVIAHSPPNIGAVAAPTQTLQGTAMITTNYANTNTSSFSLESFYFGFTIQLENGAAGLPAPANLQITGYRGLDNQIATSKQVCSHQYSYNPSTMLGGQQMASSGSISDCTDVNFVIITFSPPGGLSLAAAAYALVMDDIKFSEKGLGC